jgi:hypothetical protein
MKKISTLLLATLLVAAAAKAQTVYNVTSNRSWNSTYPGTCVNCTFNISTGVTLTIDRNITLQNPVFNGGNVVVTNYQVNLQTNGGTSYFNNTKFVFNNTSRMNGSAPIIITNSTFTFNQSSRLNSQHLFELVNSRLNFYGDSYLLATGGPVNLKNNSVIVAGDGSMSSDAYISIFGPLMSLYDNSALIVANNNNFYYNWSPYYGVASNKWNVTFINNLNCGGSNPNGCAMPYVYGPVNVTPSGVTAGNTLPVILSDFSASLVNNQTVLSWVTDQENNSDHFEVERSADGTTWTKIASIAAKGNSSVQSKYAYTDKAPVAGINYYRLKMVDMDNKYEFSGVKSVRAAFSANVRVYPNPANNFVHVSLPVATSVVRLMNTAGQVLQEHKSNAASSTVSFDVSSYSAGTYMIQVIQTDGSSRNNVLLIAK